MWIKHYLGWRWLGIKLTFELSGGTEKMFFTSSTPADSTVVSFQVISRSWNLLYWPPRLSQQNTRARCSRYKYCALNESPSGCHSVFKPVPARCLCASSPAYWMSDLKTCPALCFALNEVKWRHSYHCMCGQRQWACYYIPCSIYTALRFSERSE